MSGPQLFNILPRKFIGPPQMPFRVNWGSPQANHLRYWWPFADKGGAVVREYVLGQHGTLTNMDPGTDWVPDKIGGHAVDFNSGGQIDDHVSLGTGILAGFTKFTVCMRVFASTNDFDGTIGMILDDNGASTFSNDGMFWAFDDRDGTDQALDGLLIDSATVTDDIISRTFDNVFTSTPKWVDLINTYDGVNGHSGAQFFIDGVLTTPTSTHSSLSGTGAFDPNALEMVIGTTNGVTLPGICRVTDIRIHDDVISDAAAAAYTHDRNDLYYETGQRTYIFPAHFPPVAVAGGRIMSSQVSLGGLAGPGGIAGPGGGLAG